MYVPREIQCPTHGRVEERLHWADQYARVTYRYEYVMLRYCQMMTQKALPGYCAYRLQRSRISFIDVSSASVLVTGYED